MDEKGNKHDKDKLAFDLYPIDAYKGCTAVLTFGAKKVLPKQLEESRTKVPILRSFDETFSCAN